MARYVTAQSVEEVENWGFPLRVWLDFPSRLALGAWSCQSCVPSVALRATVRDM